MNNALIKVSFLTFLTETLDLQIAGNQQKFPQILLPHADLGLVHKGHEVVDALAGDVVEVDDRVHPSLMLG